MGLKRDDTPSEPVSEPVKPGQAQHPVKFQRFDLRPPPPPADMVIDTLNQRSSVTGRTLYSSLKGGSVEGEIAEMDYGGASASDLRRTARNAMRKDFPTVSTFDIKPSNIVPSPGQEEAGQIIVGAASPEAAKKVAAEYARDNNNALVSLHRHQPQ